MLNQRINSCCDFGNSIIAAATAMTQTVSAKRRIEVSGSSDSTTVTTIQPPNSTKAGVSSVAKPAHVVAHRQRQRQHGQAAERRIGQHLVAGG